jgi:hypothetical protein
VSAAPPLAEADACAAEAAAAFEAAAIAAGRMVLRHYVIAGLAVTLRFAGPALVERLTAALEHHPRGRPGAPGLTVSIWDASTGVPLPRFPDDAIDGGTSAGARTGATPAVRLKYRPEQRSLSVLDRAADRAVLGVVDGAALPYGETGAPLRVIFHWWMADHNRQLVHAAAVGTADRGLLLVGRGGSGKSSTALACLGSALRYAGDDYCLVSFDPAPRAHSLYGSAKLHADHARRFPGLAPALANGRRLETEKALFMVRRAFPDHLQASVRVSALVLPVLAADGRTWLERASAGAALLAVAPSTILQLPGAGRAAFDTMSRLVRQVPCYRLHLGGDLGVLPPLLEGVLAEPGAA